MNRCLFGAPSQVVPYGMVYTLHTTYSSLCQVCFNKQLRTVIATTNYSPTFPFLSRDSFVGYSLSPLLLTLDTLSLYSLQIMLSSFSIILAIGLFIYLFLYFLFHKPCTLSIPINLNVLNNNDHINNCILYLYSIQVIVQCKDSFYENLFFLSIFI